MKAPLDGLILHFLRSENSTTIVTIYYESTTTTELQRLRVAKFVSDSNQFEQKEQNLLFSAFTKINLVFQISFYKRVLHVLTIPNLKNVCPSSFISSCFELFDFLTCFQVCGLKKVCFCFCFACLCPSSPVFKHLPIFETWHCCKTFLTIL